LGAAVRVREHKRERDIRVEISIVVDVDAVHRVGVKVRPGHHRVAVDDQHGSIGILRQLECE
jgi:hypothetical protein